MAPRPTWRGYLKLSLVSCAVRLANATTASDRITFHLLNPKTHNRIQTRTVDPETGQDIPRSELVRGYEFEKGRYVIVGQAELEALQVESTKTIDLQRFVDLDAVDPLYVNSPYYLSPDGKVADETFRVIREAMARKRKAGIGRVVLSSREHPVILTPRDRGMVLMTLRSAEEVRSPTAYFEDIGEGKLDEEMIDLAGRIIDQKSGDFDPKELTGDQYQVALHELVARKIKGEKPVVAKAAPAGNVINLMDALQRSLSKEEHDRKPPAPSKKRASTKKSARNGGKRRHS